MPQSGLIWDCINAIMDSRLVSNKQWVVPLECHSFLQHKWPLVKHTHAGGNFSQPYRGMPEIWIFAARAGKPAASGLPHRRCRESGRSPHPPSGSGRSSHRSPPAGPRHRIGYGEISVRRSSAFHTPHVVNAASAAQRCCKTTDILFFESQSSTVELVGLLSIPSSLPGCGDFE